MGGGNPAGERTVDIKGVGHHVRRPRVNSPFSPQLPGTTELSLVVSGDAGARLGMSLLPADRRSVDARASLVCLLCPIPEKHLGFRVGVKGKFST